MPSPLDIFTQQAGVQPMRTVYGRQVQAPPQPRQLRSGADILGELAKLIPSMTRQDADDAYQSAITNNLARAQEFIDKAKARIKPLGASTWPQRVGATRPSEDVPTVTRLPAASPIAPSPAVASPVMPREEDFGPHERPPGIVQRPRPGDLIPETVDAFTGALGDIGRWGQKNIFAADTPATRGRQGAPPGARAATNAPAPWPQGQRRGVYTRGVPPENLLAGRARDPNGRVLPPGRSAEQIIAAGALPPTVPGAGPDGAGMSLAPLRPGGSTPTPWARQMQPPRPRPPSMSRIPPQPGVGGFPSATPPDPASSGGTPGGDLGPGGREPPDFALPPDNFEKRRAEIEAGLPKPPGTDPFSASQMGYLALLKGGLAGMTAAEQPGATLAGTIGKGGLVGLESYETGRARQSATERQKYEDELGRKKTAADIASKDEERSLKRVEVLETAKLRIATLKNTEEQREQDRLWRKADAGDKNALRQMQLDNDKATREADRQRRQDGDADRYYQAAITDINPKDVTGATKPLTKAMHEEALKKGARRYPKSSVGREYGNLQYDKWEASPLGPDGKAWTETERKRYLDEIKRNFGLEFD